MALSPKTKGPESLGLRSRLVGVDAPMATKAAAYVIGSLAMFWVLERVSSFGLAG